MVHSSTFPPKSPAHSRPSPSRRSPERVLSRTSSELSSARSSCPKDVDAFSYDPTHLKFWYLDDGLWNRLPAQLQASLADVQHAGAAALTGFERLEKHSKGFDANRVDRKISIEDLLISLDDLPPPVFRTNSSDSSVVLSDISSPPSAGSSASHSGTASPVPSHYQLSRPKSPGSPPSLGQSELPSRRPLPRERSFSTPLEPTDAYYDVELSHLRTEALPRLRHKSHKVDTVWYEEKRSNVIEQDDISTFENWWAGKKCKILELQECVKRLADERGLAPTGMGWCAP